MDYLNMEITDILQRLDSLDPNKKPLWGEMSAQRMVEHLTDTIKIASGKTKLSLVIPEDKIEKMQAFLDSDKPMAKNVEVGFAPKDSPLRHEEIELAIDEFLLEWIDFEDHYVINENQTEVHPYYGPLNYMQWRKLHAKHLNHHFEQFGINE